MNTSEFALLLKKIDALADKVEALALSLRGCQTAHDGESASRGRTTTWARATLTAVLAAAGGAALTYFLRGHT